MDMDLFGLGDFSLDMPDDVFCIGKVTEEGEFGGETAWQSILLSPFGYEICLLDLTEKEEDKKILQEEARQRGIAVTQDAISEAANCKVIAITGLFENELDSRLDLVKILEEGQKGQAKIVIDPGKITDLEKNQATLERIAPYIDYFLPNQEEAALLSGKKIMPEIAGTFLEMGMKNVVITMGYSGCFVRGEEGAPFAMGAIWGDCKDTLGIGANFMAGLIYGIFQDWQMKTRCEFATGCAAVSATYEGPVEGARERKEEIKKVLNNPYI